MAVEAINVGITGLGTYVPERVLTNQDLEKMVETSDEWILSRTGIRERRICAPDEATSDLAANAGRAAIEDAGLSPDQIDLIIVCTSTPDHLCPPTATIVQSKLGIANPVCPGFDIIAACSGFLMGCTTAAGYIKSGIYRNVLVVGADAMSRVVDFEDRNTCVLFGDGAGAAVVSRIDANGKGLLGQSMGADGSGYDLIIMPAGGSREPITGEVLAMRRNFVTMQGNEVYKFATRIVAPVIENALADTGADLKPTDLDLVIPHQANIRIIEVAARKLGLPLEKFVINIEKYGNTTAATVPLALADARADGRLQSGSLVALVAFGGGLTYAASIWRW